MTAAAVNSNGSNGVGGQWRGCIGDVDSNGGGGGNGGAVHTIDTARDVKQRWRRHQRKEEVAASGVGVAASLTSKLRLWRE